VWGSTLRGGVGWIICRRDRSCGQPNGENIGPVKEHLGAAMGSFEQKKGCRGRRKGYGSIGQGNGKPRFDDGGSMREREHLKPSGPLIWSLCI